MFSVDVQSVDKLNAEELEVAIQERSKPLIIDFYATWCGPCLLLAEELKKVTLIPSLLPKPHQGCSKLHTGKNGFYDITAASLCFVQVAEELGDSVRIVKVDTDENPELSTQLQVV